MEGLAHRVQNIMYKQKPYTVEIKNPWSKITTGEIYNLKDSTHIIRIGEHGEPEFKVSDGYGMPTGIMGFSDVQVTDSAIYTVFHGTSFKEIARQSGRLPDGGKYIYVFSLEGEPLCKYVLDHYIYGIWVDEDTKTIIATDVNDDQPIVMFSIK